MLALYAADPALAAEKATALGLAVSEQVLDMTNTVVDELESYLAGDMAEPFVSGTRAAGSMHRSGGGDGTVYVQ